MIPDKNTLACLPTGYGRFLARKGVAPLRAYAINPDSKIMVWRAYDGTMEAGVRAALEARNEAVDCSIGWCPEPNGSTLTFLTDAAGTIAWVVSPNGRIVEDLPTYRAQRDAVLASFR